MNDFNVEDEILILKNHPPVEEIESILASVLKNCSDLIINFSLVTTLLNYTIPETYKLLPERIKHRIIEIFRSVIGIGNLISKISLLKSTNDLAVHDLLSTLIEILTRCFNSGLVYNLILTRPNPSQIREVDKLLFKGKSFAILNECISSHDIKIHNDTFATSDNYVGYLNFEILNLLKQDVDLKIINTFLGSVSSFNSNSLLQYFDLMFEEPNWPYAINLCKSMKRFEQRNFVLRLISGLIAKKYFSSGTSAEKLTSLCIVLGPIFESNFVDEPFLNRIIATCNFTTNTLVAMLISRLSKKYYEELILKSLSTWADNELMKTESITLQEYRTHLIIQLISYQSDIKFIQNILDNPIFLKAISNRLSSFSNNVKNLGVILADRVCDFGGREKIFQLDNIEGYDALLKKNSFNFVKDVTIENAWNILNEPLVIEEEENKNTIVKHVEKLSISEKDSDDESEFDSDEEDDPTLSANHHISKPLYIKDILEYLSADDKLPQAYDKRRIALETGPTLIRQKSTFGNEVTFYSEDLLTQLVGLTNTYEDANFDDLRLNCLIAVVVANSPSALHLFQLLLHGDYSLKQRMCMLSAVSLAARELKGLKDEVVSNSYKEKLFPSKTLPGPLHQQFLNLENSDQKYVENNRINPIYKLLQDEIIHEASEEAKDKLSGGKILRISSSLKPKLKQNALTPKVKDFSKIIGAHFYFPLIKIWYDIGGEIDIGHYSTILTAHYIKTLALLLHVAHPTAINLKDMIKEFFLIVSPLIQKISVNELQIIESAVTGVLLICDIMDEQYLMMHFHNDLGIFHRWLSLSWEGLIDDKVKSLCAGLLLRLNELYEKFERVLIDQRNGIY